MRHTPSVRLGAVLADLTPLRTSPAFRRLWAGYSLAAVGTAFGYTAVALQAFDLTGSSAAVGLVGLAGLGPLVVMGLWGGTLSDVHDRRTVALTSGVVLWLTAIGLALQAWLGIGSLALVLVLVGVQAGGQGVNAPARSAMVPRLLEPALLPAANALQGASQNLATIVGPLLAGLLVARFGVAPALTVDAVVLGVALVLLAGLPRIPPLEAPTTRAGWSALVAGARLLRGWPTVRMTFVLDVVAMLTSWPRALFPAVGLLVLGGGAETAGALLAAFAAGSLATTVLSGGVGGVRHHGRAITLSIMAWGACIAVFGVVLALAPPLADPSMTTARNEDGLPWGSPFLWGAMLALAGAGASDAMSAIFRQSVLQSATPDGQRGLLGGVFIVVVAGGPRLGEAVSGVLAARFGEAIVPIVGGLVCIAVVAVLVRRARGFWDYDARHPVP